jgi:DNA-binding NarL/FixJ family response regulator
MEGKKNCNTKEEIEKVLELYSSGLSCRKIENILHISDKRVSEICKEYGILRDNHKKGTLKCDNKAQKEIPIKNEEPKNENETVIENTIEDETPLAKEMKEIMDENIQKVLSLYESGLSAKKVGKELHIGEKRVREICKEHGVLRQSAIELTKASHKGIQTKNEVATTQEAKPAIELTQLERDILQLYNKGLNAKKVGKELHIGDKKVREVCKKFGVIRMSAIDMVKQPNKEAKEEIKPSINKNMHGMDEDTISKVVELYKSGLNAKKVGKELHVAEKRVREICKEHGVLRMNAVMSAKTQKVEKPNEQEENVKSNDTKALKKQDYILTDEKIVKIIELYKSGMNAKKVGKEVHIAEEKVRMVCREHGILRKNAPHPKNANPKTKETQEKFEKTNETNKKADEPKKSIILDLMPSTQPQKADLDEMSMKVVKMYKGGLSVRQIAKALGIFEEDVKEICMEQGLFHLNIRELCDTKELVRRHKRGASVEDLAMDFNLNPKEVASFLKDYYEKEKYCNKTYGPENWHFMTKDELMEMFNYVGFDSYGII